MSFHADCYGKNITLIEGATIASRENPVKAAYLPYGQGATFTSTPLDINASIIIEILATDDAFAGTLNVGFTNQDPTSLKRLPTSTVPDFASKPGNWCTALEESIDVGDWVTVDLSRDGKSVSVTVNGCMTRNYQHGGKIDSSQPLWGIVDVYGSVTKVRLLIVKSSDIAEADASASDEDIKATLDGLLCTSECSTPLDIKLRVVGEDAEAVSLIRKGLLKKSESERENGSTDELLSITHCRDWIPRSIDTDLEKHVISRYADCVVRELKIRQASGEKVQSTPTKTGIELENALGNKIIQRVKFNLLKKVKNAATEPAESTPTKPGLTILDFTPDALEKSLHEMFLRFPLFSPLLMVYVIDYDNINIDKENPDRSIFVTQLHAALRMIFSRVRPPTEEQTEHHHKPYLSPPVILAGVYEESGQSCGKIEEIESLIRGSLGGKVYQPHVISLYHAIPHQNKELISKSYKMVEDLRKHISRTAQGEQETGPPIPLWWSLLRTQLKSIGADGKQTLSPQKVSSLCSDISVTSEDIQKAFHHLNEAGVLLSAANQDGPFAFLEPIKTMELVQMAMTVIDPAERWATHERLWSKLKKDGILSEPLLNHVWKDNISDKELLLDLMMGTHLLYEITGSGEKSRQFVIPALLPEGEVLTGPGKDGDIRLYIDFHGTSSDRVFLGLVLALRSWAISNDYSVTRIMKNRTDFAVGSSIDLVVSKCSFDQSIIQIDIRCSDSAEGGSIPDPVMSMRIRDEIKARLGDLAKTGHHREFSSRFCVKCSTCDSLVDLEDCLDKPAVSCANGHKITTSSIQRWFRSTGATPGPAITTQTAAKETDEKSNRIFISFSFKAVDKAEHLKRRIDEAFGPGASWICTESISGGQVIRREIARAMANASVVICAASEGYADSKECQSEVNLARELKKEIIPVLLDELEWPLKVSGGEISEMATIFAGTLYQSAFSKNSEDLEWDIQRVIDAIRRTLGEPTP